MKNYILLFVFLIPLALSAQRNKARDRMQSKKLEEKNLKYYNEIFGTADKDFKITEGPAEWKDKPVVVLCQKTHISFLRNPASEGNLTKGVIRKRILIQDKAALDEFSEFYYQESVAVGINHIKAKGKKSKIDLANAIKVETDIPDFYKDSYHSEDYYKITIPNLEVGDILDFFKVFEEAYGSNVELISPITYSYPVLTQEIIFDVDKLWTFYHNSFNGAPKFKADPNGGVDANGRRRKLVKRFVMRDKKQDAQKDERWDFTYVTEPIIKIMAVPPKGSFADKKDPIKTKIDLKDAFQKSMANTTNLLATSSLATLRKLKVKGKSDKEKIDLIYRQIRISFLGMASSPNYALTGAYGYSNISNTYNVMKSNYFASTFSSLLSSFDIKSELVMIVPRYYGNEKQVITLDELEFGVYIPSTKKYYWTVDNYSIPGENISSTFGAKGYRIPESALRKRNPEFKSITIPSSDPSKNVTTIDMDITVNSNNTLDIKHSAKYKGAYRPGFSGMFLYNTDVYEDEKSEFTSEKNKKKFAAAEARAKGKKKSKKSREQEAKAKERNKEVDKEKKEMLENWVKDDYEVDEFKDYELISPGITTEANVLQMDSEFTSKGYLQKAGPNFIFEIGKLITSQVQLKEEEIKERTKTAQFSYAKTIENNFKIKLPEGLAAQGLDAFNMNVDNPDGAFISSASQTGNVLTVKTSKVYKKQTVPLANWKNLVEMLEAAYKFSQLKMILKKA